MQRNNDFQALEIVTKASAELSKLNFDSGSPWAEFIMAAKEQLQFAADEMAEEIERTRALRQEN